MEFNKLFKKIIIEADQTSLLKQMISGDDKPTEETPKEPSEENPEETEEPKEDEKDKETEDEGEDDENEEKDKEQKEKQVIDDERTKKLEKYVNEVISNLKFQVDKNAKIILSDFRTYGATETIKRFIENIFIPHVTESDEKIFLTLNIDEFAEMTSEKLGNKFLQVK